MRLLITLMPFLLPVMASDHKQCDCQVIREEGAKWGPDWQLTFNICKKVYYNTAEYDFASQRCIARPHVRLDGDRFYENCKKLGEEGYHPVIDGAINYIEPVIKVKQGGSGCYN